MAEVRIEIKNLPQIRSAFRQAPIRMIRNLNKAIAKSVLSIEGESMRHTPVDTGYLRASHSQGRIIRSLYGEVKPEANYGLFVHEGTRYMRGRPFLFNAVRTKEGEVQRYFEDSVQDTLDEVGRDAD